MLPAYWRKLLETYMSMFWEYHEAEMEQLAEMREWLDKFEKKVG
jgi:hypothetical protein